MLPSIRTVASCLAVLALLVLAPPPTHAQTAKVFTVDDTGDDPDVDDGDGTCATAGGVCTLRAAIQQANASTNTDGPDRIEFDLNTSQVINPSSPLPEITDPVVIDGTTASAGSLPRLRLDGCASCGDGLVISAGDSEVRGLQIVRFAGHGIVLTGGGNNVV